jgi:hypothetical protein
MIELQLCSLRFGLVLRNDSKITKIIIDEMLNYSITYLKAANAFNASPRKPNVNKLSKSSNRDNFDVECGLHKA